MTRGPRSESSAYADIVIVGAGHAGARCYLWGARRRRVVGGVVRNGFEMVNGPGLMRDVGAPAGVVSAPRRRFLLHPCAPA